MRVVNAKDIFQDLPAILPLILDIMDGENRLDTPVIRAGRKHQVVINRDKGSLPVIAVDDIGLEIDIGKDFKHCLGK